MTSEDKRFISLTVDDGNIYTETSGNLIEDPSFQFIYDNYDAKFIKGKPEGSVKKILMQIIDIINKPPH